ncbi:MULTISPECIES: polyamine aminopropyltransferase [unclassified Paraflavitalea]|uniref:polyamine aminopropyltransferase n=1 Tax=unclassified Paraflavitalea TaxID=2798305 RepID=UPI003D32D281
MSAREKKEEWILLLAVFVIATCGLIYELVAGTLASYLLGDSVTQFSTIIGVYLFSMGIGSYLSKFFKGNLLRWFVKTELLVGMVGGFSSILLFLLFPVAESFRIVLYALVGITGILVGVEIPLLMRILENRLEFKELISRVFSFDYIGALLASIIFPLLLVPHLGIIRTSLFFGILNIGVGWYLVFKFKEELRNTKPLHSAAIILLLSSAICFAYADKIMNYSETLTFNDQVVYATSTPYQRIVITKNKKETRLFLNGNLQFSSADEYRYHEALVHPALSSLPSRKNILVLGGGDGLAVREILKYPDVEKITLVDLDPKMTELFSSQSMLMSLNHESLKNKKLTIVNADAYIWLRKNSQVFNAIIVDFPDPSNYSIGKLYSSAFYNTLYKSLDEKGLVVIQSTSPYVAPKSFWCVDQTLRSVGLQTKAYHNYVPSFGEWGYIMAMKSSNFNWFSQLPTPLRFLNKETINDLFVFPEDMKTTAKLEINRLNNQALVTYFEEEWSKFLEP